MKYMYRTIKISALEDTFSIDTVLSRNGEDGWEVIKMSSFVYGSMPWLVYLLQKAY